MTILEPTVGEPLLSIENLSVKFGRFTALKPMSYTIRRGQTLAVVGESGSGKSVSALAMMRLLPNTADVGGRIMFEGTDLLGLSEREMRNIRGGRISMIFQEPMTSLNPVQRVGDQIAEAVRYHRGMTGNAAMEEVGRLMERVGIRDVESRIGAYPHTFSGGMRQRVMIAMALASNPALLIADEPTTALDVTIQAQIIELMQEIQRDTGVSILFITHDMGVVAEIADDVLVMKSGDLIEHGAVKPIFDGAEAEYTRSLIAAVPQLASGLSDTVKQLPSPREGELLSVDDLTVRFAVRAGLLARHKGNIHAVEGVSLSIRAGETLGLVGESGSGKSTIGRAVMNLEKIYSGTVKLAGRPIEYSSSAARAAFRRDVQMIFQDPYGSLDGRQTVGNAIMEPIIFHRIANKAEARDRMKALLARVGLPTSVANRYPHEFSGGQRQRICIARALAMEPKLIIADEAVSALDVTVKAQIIELMIGLQEEFGLSYLFISHDIAAVERICHRVAVMHFGEIVEVGPREAVIGSPSHGYTQRLLSAVPIAHPDLRGTRKQIPDDGKRPSPMRPIGYSPPVVRWREAGPGHLVRTETEVASPVSK
ncbi:MULTISPECIES: ABC transporter ATP-binding protein [unclassified Rhizobium]|uniref:ABC transporter ATP-binding protein n=1 Tax=unclassified Rhizobium TaxID=2613769 RepID=UPI001ADB033C|nr:MULTISPECIES: ABC transporter ATP-binding protein [unclassified Rhizobium]MBO9126512.1 ABC transporter ATP-binding protein [Rhizobium sp. 16-488-2b]MBO9178447.1 ABC transporter ATP-binding protein [Rhizobium sp. 16-488-2a]MBO9194992.1 ABC transporter ATP-binding protein [Rhizobium sp. 16-449-1b]